MSTADIDEPIPIVLADVCRRYGEHVVLDGFCMTLHPGKVTAVTGPNGAGKTTVARLVLGLDVPDAGTITGLAGVRRAAVFQEDRLCGHLDAVTNVRLGLERAEWPTAGEHLRGVGLGGDTTTVPVAQLSGGQRRRVAIARALAGTAPLVVLDEPFAGIDAPSKPAVMAYVRERLMGRTALLITHDRDEAAWFAARLVRLTTRTAT